jgi:hypothetical protein
MSLDNLMNGTADKEAAAIWGAVNEQAQKEDAGRPSGYWNWKNGEIAGKVARVYQRQNYDKDGYNPTLDLETSGGVIVVEASHKVLQKELARQMPGTGDTVRIKPLGKAPGRNYVRYEVEVSKNLPAGEPGF